MAQPIYCLSAADRSRLALLAAIDHNCQLADLPLTDLPDGGDPDTTLHWLTPSEMAARYDAFPDALAQVGEVVARCQPALPDGRRLWPVLDLPAAQTPEVYYGSRPRYLFSNNGGGLVLLGQESGSPIVRLHHNRIVSNTATLCTVSTLYVRK